MAGHLPSGEALYLDEVYVRRVQAEESISQARAFDLNRLDASGRILLLTESQDRLPKWLFA